MCILRDPKTLGKVPVSVCLFRGVLHPPSGKWPCNGLFWGSALWKGKSLESISHCSHKSRHSPVLLCLTSQPKLCIGTQGLTSIQIKVSFEKKEWKCYSSFDLSATKKFKLYLTYTAYFIIHWWISTFSTMKHGMGGEECWKVWCDNLKWSSKF